MANLTVLEEEGLCELDQLPRQYPRSPRSVLRNVDGETITVEDVRNNRVVAT